MKAWTSRTTLRRCNISSRSVARGGLREKIVFTDYYPASAVGRFTEPAQIIDPVNRGNNVARLYSNGQADAIVDSALDAGDLVDAALAAPTKQATLHYWRRVFGPSLHG